MKTVHVGDASLTGKAGAAAILMACIVVAGAGIWLQSRVHINHDVAWIAHSAGWMLEGKRFGSEILDPNPPMAWYVMLPAAAMARTGIASEILCIQVWCWLLTLGALALSAAVLRRLVPAIGSAEAAVLLVAGAGVLCILPVGDFGQREVIAFAFLLPYVYGLALRAGGAPGLSGVLAVSTGVAAGFAVCLKPYLIIVPLLAEAVGVVIARSIRIALRAETVAMACAAATYAIAVVAFARDYLDVALPLVSASYWAYEGSDYVVEARFRDVAVPAAYAIAAAAVTASFTRIHALLLVALGGFSASYWIQSKGFPYHAYPILGAACVLLAYSIVRASRLVLRTPRIRSAGIRGLLVIAMLAVTVPVLMAPFRDALSWYRSADRKNGSWGMLREAPAARLRQLGIEPADYLYAFSTHPHPGFPTVNYLGVRWAGTAVAQFVIPAQARRSEIAVAAERMAVDRAVEQQVEIVIDDLSRHRPKFVLVEARQRRLGLGYRRFDDLAFYSRDERFARLWACYEELAPIGQIRLFRVRGECEA